MIERHSHLRQGNNLPISDESQAVRWIPHNSGDISPHFLLRAIS